MVDGIQYVRKSLHHARHGFIKLRETKRDRRRFDGFKRDALINSNSVFLFSVIIAVYNAEEYLDETIESILSQTIGFEDSIQLILVDDGSTDSSSAICKRYVAKYPENIVYAFEENQGASAARNLGLSLAEGAFVNFLDSDDTWDADAFEQAALFFFRHPDIPLVSFKIKFTGASEKDHPLNYKFEDTRVIDITKHHNLPQLSAPSAILNRKSIPEKGFDTRLSVSEDFKLVSQVILNAGRYGVINGAAYHYRKHFGASSLIGSSTVNRSWYFQTPILCYKALFDYSREHYGEVIPYIQFAVMYDLQWRLIKSKNPHFLSDAEEKDYLKILVDLLQSISYRVILRQRNLNGIQRIYVAALKEGISFTDAQSRIFMKNHSIYYQPPSSNVAIRFPGKAERHRRVNIRIIEITDRQIRIEGSLAFCFPLDRISLFLVDACGRRQPIAFFTYRHCGNESSFFKKDYYQYPCFSVVLPLEETQTFHFIVCVDNKEYLGKLAFNPLSRMSNARSYHYINGYLLVFDNGTQRLSVTRVGYDYRKMDGLEHRYLKSLPKSALSDSLISLRKKAIADRKRKGKRQLWLLSDRVSLADDNGAALFRYLCEHPVVNTDIWFVLSNASEQFNELSNIGNVVDYGTEKYKLLFLAADKIISSSADDYTLNAFGEAKQYMCDLYQFDFIFLQHGVTKDDQSHWLNKWNKNIWLLVTAAKRERESFIQGSYRYTEDQIMLSGFPRHDLLDFNRKPEHKILLMPTWRSNLAGRFNPISGIREKNPIFKQTEYYRFYNGLINDQRLISYLAKSNYRIEFVLHPAFIQEAETFESNEYVSVFPSANYSSEFATGAMLITDYSSVAFDFALFKKPILYAQFDCEAFFDSHLYDAGYFDYKADGFGPVITNLDELVQRIIDTITRNCIIDECYRQRIDSFFFEPGVSRCQLVTEGILNHEAMRDTSVQTRQ